MEALAKTWWSIYSAYAKGINKEEFLAKARKESKLVIKGPNVLLREVTDKSIIFLYPNTVCSIKTVRGDEGCSCEDCKSGPRPRRHRWYMGTTQSEITLSGVTDKPYVDFRYATPGQHNDSDSDNDYIIHPHLDDCGSDICWGDGESPLQYCKGSILRYALYARTFLETANSNPAEWRLGYEEMDERYPTTRKQYEQKIKKQKVKGV